MGGKTVPYGMYRIVLTVEPHCQQRFLHQVLYGAYTVFFARPESIEEIFFGLINKIISSHGTAAQLKI